MRAKDFILELGNNPYPMPKRWKGSYGSAEKETILPDGRKLVISIEEDDGVAIINFYIDDTQTITGKGDAYRVFSTVAQTVGDYARKRKPSYIAFTSRLDEQSRIKLYDRLVNSAMSSPELSKYMNVTDEKEYWRDDLEFILDDFQDIQDQKIYVLMRVER
jgi:hypothetical protein